MTTSTHCACATLGLLGLLLAGAVATDMKARRDGVSVPARAASAVLLQGSPDSAASSGEEGDILFRLDHDWSPKTELALARFGEPIMQEGKATTVVITAGADKSAQDIEP